MCPGCGDAVGGQRLDLGVMGQLAPAEAANEF